MKIFIFVILLITLLAGNAYWEKPILISEAITSQLLEDFTIKKYFSKDKKNFFAPTSFVTSLKYFLKKEDSHVFGYYRYGKNWFTTEFYTGIDFAIKKDVNYNFSYTGMVFSAKFNENLHFYSDWYKGHYSGFSELSELNGAELIDSWYQLSDDKNQLYVDNLKAQLQYKSDFFDLVLGRDALLIGNSIGGSIILNDLCNEYGFIGSKWKLGKWEFSSVQAAIIPDSTTGDYTKFNEKFIASHSVKFNYSQSLQLFFGEHIVYGNRGIDLNYFLPIAFYRIIEHNLADRDNALIFGGLSFYLNNNLFYFNFIFDELKKSEIFSDWWGNKYAAQIGYSHCLDTILQKVSIEFTAVRPWIYTHKYLENKFSHDEISLGFPDGSNLIQFATEFEWILHPDIHFINNFSYTIQGSIGNQFYINYEDRTKETTYWLEGIKTDKKEFVSVINWQILAHHSMKASFIAVQKNSKIPESKFKIGYQAKF